MQHAEVKRFLDRYRGDPQFRSEAEHGLCSVPREWVEIAASLSRCWWQPSLSTDGCHSSDPQVSRYLEWRADQWELLRESQEGAPAGNRAYRDWRARQIGRLATQTAFPQWDLLAHRPFAIELTRGCSVGCEYCGLAAGPLSGRFAYTSDNRRLFTAVLDVLDDFFGPGTQYGMLYWATEPLDNPDYEAFLQAFFERFGVTPPTTTAAWQRDIPRTKRLLQRSRTCHSPGDRLSINSLRQFHLCLGELSAAELESVDLVLQYAQADVVYCASGRGATVSPTSPIKTFCCVTGFLINLVERSVALISPCPASRQWPLGYAVYRRGHFESGEELAAFVGECEQEIMNDPLRDDLVLSLRGDLTAEDTPEGLQALATVDARVKITDRCERSILEAVRSPTSVGRVVDLLEQSFGSALVYYRLRKLRQCGLFEHLPETLAITEVNG